jgi:hypothetical protein
MKKFIILITMAILAVGCTNNQELVKEALNSVGDRPEWIMNEPLVDGDTFYFVGISSLYATEKGARRDAKRDAMFTMMEYLNTIAQAKFEEAQVSYGLEGALISPTISNRGYTKFVSMNVIRRMRATKWYFERENDMLGRPGYKYFVLTFVPKEDIFLAFKKTARQNVVLAKQEAKQALNAQAKNQAEQATKFWQMIEKEGINQDDLFNAPRNEGVVAAQ